MGNINFLAVFVSAAAMFVVGMVWYGLLFGKAWQREVGLSDEQVKSGNPFVIFGLTFAFELLVCLMLGHNFARLQPADHVIMMMCVGTAIAFMIPAIGINYLYQRRSGKLFAIDAGHFLFGMAAVGAVFILMGPV